MGKSEKDEEKNSREALLLERKKITYNLVLLLAASFVVLIGALTMAWFASNNQVNGTNMSVTVQNGGFELQVKGTNIANSSTFSGFSIFSSEFIDGIQQVDDGDNLINVFRTGVNAEKIIWRRESPSGFYPEGLKPGSYGTLTFWVVPSRDGEQNIQFKFSIRGFHAKKNANGAVTGLYEINDALEATTENGLDNATLAAKKQALEYVRGHILFFACFENSYYSGFEKDGIFYFNDFLDPADRNLVAGQEYPVTIYWKWINDIGDLFLPSTSSYASAPIFADSNTDDREIAFEYLSDADNVFTGMSQNEIETALMVIQEGSSNVSYKDSLSALIEGYDNADMDIGNNVNYILIEMAASPMQ